MANMFVTGVIQRIDLGDGDWVEIRKLSGKQLRDAARARQREAADAAREFGGDVLASLRAARDAGRLDTSALEAAAADPLETYDRWTVLALGIVAWSADRRVNQSAIDELDDAVSERIAREILAITLPPADPAEREAARKND